MHGYNYNKLFEHKETVASNLKKLMRKRRYDEKRICEKTRIKESDLAKILEGSFKNKKTFDKTIFSLMKGLKILPEILLGDIVPNEIRKIRMWENLSQKDMSGRTGIPGERLEEIESGSAASLEELRSIAYALGVGVEDLLGNNVFSIQVHDFRAYALRAGMEEQIENDMFSAQSFFNTAYSYEDDISAFCGYVGILFTGNREYQWFPVSVYEKTHIISSLQSSHIICVKTMNNKILLINMEKVNNVIYSDIFRGSVTDMVLNAKDPDLGLKMVVYEALPDYLSCIESGEKGKFAGSDKFKNALDEVIECCMGSGCTYDDIAARYDEVTIHFDGAATAKYAADFNSDMSLADDIEEFIRYEEETEPSAYYVFKTIKGDRVVGMYSKANMIELPLTTVAKRILKKWDEIFLSSLDK